MKAIIPVLFALTISLSAFGQTPWPTPRWKVSSPASLGLNQAPLTALDRALASGKYGYIDGLLVIRHGKVGYEKAYRHDYAAIYRKDVAKKSALNSSDPGGPYNYFNPWWHPYYHATDLHTLQSVTKTVTSAIIGVAIARHEFPDLDTPVLRFFDTTAVKHLDGRKRRMTLRHLLTMTAGLAWNEDTVPYADPTNDGSRMEASHDWVKYVLDKPMAEEPGKVFNYNGGATQTLAHLFRVATGYDLEEYGAKHLFQPLGIRRYYWKRAPSGLVDAQGGLYLAQKDLAKICYLYLQAGNWQGKQLIQADYVHQSVAPLVRVSPGVAYGYQWWHQSYGKKSTEVAWQGSGFGGQFALVLPQYDTVVILTAWNILPTMPYPTAALVIDYMRRAVNGPTKTTRAKP
ncbi:serine hydrolase [Hymenobacter nivis]|uniref:Serine hydrolase n=1 Tax=Hymenobacter nivis TaxID=1850093 RepID=A0A2Z3GS15_9BACT|nr:serine hydrolase [Hymenobacter nivis]